MTGILLDQTDIAIDTSTLVVPALLCHGIATYRKDIIAPIVQIFRQVILLRGITTGLCTKIEAIAKDLGIAENTSKAHTNSPSFVFLTNSKVLAIPANRVLWITPSHLFIAVRVTGLTTIG